LMDGQVFGGRQGTTIIIILCRIMHVVICASLLIHKTVSYLAHASTGRRRLPGQRRANRRVTTEPPCDYAACPRLSGALG
jgi:hypothetical protein